MTWSIIARDQATGRMGIAVATKFFAVGSMVPHIRSGVGAVASQAMLNPFFGPRGLALMAAGASAEEAVNLMTVADDDALAAVLDKDCRTDGSRAIDEMHAREIDVLGAQPIENGGADHI